jgi:hypothetical protein
MPWRCLNLSTVVSAFSAFIASAGKAPQATHDLSSCQKHGVAFDFNRMRKYETNPYFKDLLELFRQLYLHYLPAKRA